MFGSSWCHHCHELFPSVYETSKKAGTTFTQLRDAQPVTSRVNSAARLSKMAVHQSDCHTVVNTIRVCLQFPKHEFVVAQMDYMDQAVKVSLS